MATISLAQANNHESIPLTREKGNTLQRKKFSISGKILLLACLPLFPIVFPVVMLAAYYQDKKLEESGFYDEY